MNAHFKQSIAILLVYACSLHFLVCHGKLRPAGIFTDYMVLQRDITNPVWGWASPGERIMLYFDSVVISSTSDDRGFWRILLPGSGAGGPFSMKITGESDTVVFKNILIGDVWLRKEMVLPADFSRKKLKLSLGKDCLLLRSGWRLADKVSNFRVSRRSQGKAGLPG